MRMHVFVNLALSIQSIYINTTIWTSKFPITYVWFSTELSCFNVVSIQYCVYQLVLHSTIIRFGRKSETFHHHSIQYWHRQDRSWHQKYCIIQQNLFLSFSTKLVLVSTEKYRAHAWMHMTKLFSLFKSTQILHIWKESILLSTCTYEWISSKEETMARWSVKQVKMQNNDERTCVL